MKKTLIALAAIAATGASFAQVSITGNLTAGYSQTVSNQYISGTQAGNNRVIAQNLSSGFGVDTAEVNFTAKEDLGGGQSVQAVMGLTNVYRGAAAVTAGGGNFGANDLTLTYTNNSVGRFQYKNTLGAAVFSGLPTAGAPTIAFDGKLFEQRAVSEAVQYAVPIGPVTLAYEYGEAGAGAAGTGLGIGQGTAGASNNVRQRSNAFVVRYTDGPFDGFFVYKGYDNHYPDFATNVTVPLSKDVQYSLQGAYDFGVAKVGFGMAYTRLDVGVVETDYLIGLNVPVGAVELGATFASSTVGGLRDLPANKFTPGTALQQAQAKALMQEAEGTATGFSLGAKYNLSKRTNLTTNYAQWTRSGYAQFESQAAAGQGVFGAAPLENQWNVLLSHSF